MEVVTGGVRGNIFLPLAGQVEGQDRLFQGRPALPGHPLVTPLLPNHNVNEP